MRTVLVTGATGFVGRSVVARLRKDGSFRCIAATRQPKAIEIPDVEVFQMNDLGAITDYGLMLRKVDAVVHLAARVHVMKDAASDPLAEFRKVNVAGTLNLARQAADAGVRRFIFISSIKVNGESTKPGDSFRADDAPCPIDPYGISKLEAEQELMEVARETGMEVVIIRPPLVYGPGVKGNFASMMKWLGRGFPLPLGAIQNSRSLVALDNLVDFINTCIVHPAAANQVFLVSDGEDISTTELLRRLACELNRPARLLPVPASTLEFTAGLLGRRSVAQRLCGSLTVSIEKNEALLDWRPQISLREGLTIAAKHFLSTGR